MLDKIIGSVLSNMLGGSNNNTSGSIVTDVLGSLIRNQGGMEGIFNQLQKGGLDDLLNSWIGTEKNQPMNPNQVNDVFGDETLSQVAQQAGVDKSQAQDILSQALPQIIDMLTPNGREGGVTMDSLQQQVQRQQQDNGFGLDDLLGGLLGGAMGGSQASQQSQYTQQSQQPSIQDVLGQILGQQQPTRTSQTSAPSSNNELAQDIGAVLNNFFK
ncbi:MAG: YidB family protein [[Actinobacillus] rossii]|nr:YidB family protein [[Actinobacillus] rossii]MDY4505036.1 YidB family protein [[Actinobacillus] rossii]